MNKLQVSIVIVCMNNLKKPISLFEQHQEIYHRFL